MDKKHKLFEDTTTVTKEFSEKKALNSVLC